MKNIKYSLITGLVIFSLGSTLLAWGTDSFQAFTSESARRLSITQASRLLPEATLQNQDGRYFALRDLHGKLLVVDFIYTTCPTICNALGSSFQQISRYLSAGSLDDDVVLLSISFNPERDNPEQLRNYAERFKANGESWRIVRVEDQQQLVALLETLGVVVIANEFGGFEHNAAIHLIDRSGRLVSIDDHDQIVAFTEKLNAWL